MTSIVPKRARPMPIEQMRRYFHIASRAPRLRWYAMSGAETSVVSSTATHMSGRLGARSAKSIAPKNAQKQR